MACERCSGYGHVCKACHRNPCDCVVCDTLACLDCAGTGDAPNPSMIGTCVYCGGHAEGFYGIHRDGMGEGPEVPLCIACGSKPEPTCEEIWVRIAVSRAIGEVSS